MKSVEEYLSELQKGKEDRPQQVRDAMEIYIDLWKKVIEKGVVGWGDDVGQALAKIEESGGLYAAAED
jgi:hypothetical protein